MPRLQTHSRIQICRRTSWALLDPYTNPDLWPLCEKVSNTINKRLSLLLHVVDGGPSLIIVLFSTNSRCFVGENTSYLSAAAAERFVSVYWCAWGDGRVDVSEACIGVSPFCACVRVCSIIHLLYVTQKKSIVSLRISYHKGYHCIIYHCSGMCVWRPLCLCDRPRFCSSCISPPRVIIFSPFFLLVLCPSLSTICTDYSLHHLFLNYAFPY